jgi:hypothetical protein
MLQRKITKTKRNLKAVMAVSKCAPAIMHAGHAVEARREIVRNKCRS